MLLWLTSATRAPWARWSACAAVAWAFAGLAPVVVLAQGPPTNSRQNLDRPIGWLGITIQEVSEEVAERLAARFGVAAGTGVLVVEAIPGGPAAAAGLQRGDVIVAMNGQPIWDVRQLQRRVRAAPLGAPANIEVLRERERVQVPVRVGAMPEEAMASVLAEALGFGVPAAQQDVGRAPARRPAPEGQVVITAVDPRSPAGAAGLRPSDVVLEVDGRAVKGLKDLYAALRGAAGKPAFPLAVDRDGTRHVLTLAPGAAPPSP